MIAILELLFLLCFVLSTTQAKIVIDDACSQAEREIIHDAMRDAKEALLDANIALRTQKLGDSGVAFDGAYDPLLPETAFYEVKNTVGNILDLFRENTHRVTLFCPYGSEKAVVYDTKEGIWVQLKWQNRGSGGYDYGSLPYLAANDWPLPPSAGASSILGERYSPEFDYSEQSHIHLWSKFFTVFYGPPATSRLTLNNIKKYGPLEGKTHLDNILDPGRTLIHELAHVAGGFRDKVKKAGEIKITDGPNGDIYTWGQCNQLMARGHSTHWMADCLTQFIMACYMQIENKNHYATCWRTGKPALTVPKRRARRSLQTTQTSKNETLDAISILKSRAIFQERGTKVKTKTGTKTGSKTGGAKNGRRAQLKVATSGPCAGGKPSDKKTTQKVPKKKKVPKKPKAAKRPKAVKKPKIPKKKTG